MDKEKSKNYNDDLLNFKVYPVHNIKILYHDEIFLI